MRGLLPTVHSFVEQVLTREQSVRQRTHALLLATAFWSAITLPFLYLPFLLTGLDTTAQLTVFLGLVALNAVALLFGHSYSAD